MALSALDDPSVAPTDEQVALALGRSLGAWQRLREWLGSSAGVNGWEWRFSGKKYGWALRAKSGERNIAYLIPQRGSFLVGLVLGDRAMEVARTLELSPAAADVISAAKRYVEGTGFRLPVTRKDDLADIEKLIGAKLGR